MEKSVLHFGYACFSSIFLLIFSYIPSLWCQTHHVITFNQNSDSFSKELVNLVNENKGKHSLVINVVDYLNKYEVDLLSRKIKVDLNKEFISKIKSLDKIKIMIR